VSDYCLGTAISFLHPPSISSPKVVEMKNVVFGASGMVGGFIATHLSRSGEAVVGISRLPRLSHEMTWAVADLLKPETIDLPKADIVFCATDARIFAKAMSAVIKSSPKRVVVISSTSIFSKIDSRDEAERASIAELVDAERTIMSRCEEAGVEWTILRPTLIYLEGRDRNVTQIAKLIRKIGFMPLYGAASGLRQPVHAEDLGIGAISAAKSSKAANAAYSTTGIETISYREMAGRIFDGLSRKRRLVSLPPIVWRSAFAVVKPVYPWVTPAMGERMLKDLAFDSSAAAADFGWRARHFAPSFPIQIDAGLEPWHGELH
jgi:nucleoside-diphosphate-sugar epimerase